MRETFDGIALGDFTELDKLIPDDGNLSELQKINLDTAIFEYLVSIALRSAHKAIIINNPTSVEEYSSNKCVLPALEAKTRIKKIIYKYAYLFRTYPLEDWLTTADEDFSIKVSIINGGPEGFYLEAVIKSLVTDVEKRVMYPKYTDAEVQPITHPEVPTCKLNSNCPMCKTHCTSAVDPNICSMHANSCRQCTTCTLAKTCACYQLVCPPTEPEIITYDIVSVGVLCNVTDIMRVNAGSNASVKVVPNVGCILDSFAIDGVTYSSVPEANNAFAENEDVSISMYVENIDGIESYIVKFDNVNADHNLYFTFKEKPAVVYPYTIHVTTSDGITCNATENGRTGLDVNPYDDALVHFSISEHGEFSMIKVDDYTFDSMESAIKILDDEEFIDAEMYSDGSYGIRFMDVVADHYVDIEMIMRKEQLTVTCNGCFVDNDMTKTTYSEEVNEGSNPSVEIFVPENYHISGIKSLSSDIPPVTEDVYVHGELEYTLGSMTEEVLEDGRTMCTITVDDIEQTTVLDVSTRGNDSVLTVNTVNCSHYNKEDDSLSETATYAAHYGEEVTFTIQRPKVSEMWSIKINDLEYSITGLEEGNVVTVAGGRCTIIPVPGITDDESVRFDVTIKVDRADTMDVTVIANRKQFTISEKIINARVASPSLPMIVDSGSDLDVVITANPGTFFSTLVVTNGVVSATIVIGMDDVGESGLYSFGRMTWDKITRTYTVEFRNISDNWTIMGSTVTFIGEEIKDYSPTETTDSSDT